METNLICGVFFFIKIVAEIEFFWTVASNIRDCNLKKIQFYSFDQDKKCSKYSLKVLLYLGLGNLFMLKYIIDK